MTKLILSLFLVLFLTGQARAAEKRAVGGYIGNEFKIFTTWVDIPEPWIFVARSDHKVTINLPRVDDKYIITAAQLKQMVDIIIKLDEARDTHCAYCHKVAK